MDYVKKISTNAIAKKVKIADLKHNSDVTRLSVVDDVAKIRLSKYNQALELLLK